jgi:glycosyltransferase involved in cell wall biosynthesis
MAVKHYNKVLFISYYFPPVGGGGVQRSAKFVKYLPQFGWQPCVLTVKEPYDFYRDDTLLSDIPSSVPIYRSISIEPMKWVRKLIFRLWQSKLQNSKKLQNSTPKTLKSGFLVKIKQILLFPDNEMLWLPFGFSKGLVAIYREKPQAIFSTASPFTAHLIALMLSRVFGLPWIADFRDLWVDRPNFPPGAWRRFIDRKLEKLVLRGVTHLTTVSQVIAQRFMEIRPEIKFTVIPNGYDENDFANLESPKILTDFFQITYTGIFNHEQNPGKFFRAVKELIKQREDFREKVHLKFIGQLDNPGEFENLALLKETGLTPYSEIVSYQPHETVIREMQSATILFLLVGEYPLNEAILTGKLFEYLRARRPILAVVPPKGSAAQIIRQTRSGLIVSNENERDIQEGLLAMFNSYLEGKLEEEYFWKGIEKYERKNLTEQLATVLNRISLDNGN